MDSRIDTLLQAVDAAIAANLASKPQFSGLYDMMRHHFGWLEPSDAATAGKKLRPLLCLLAAEAVCGDWRKALPAATAVELVHNFSLIHDDIQDQSRMRRHRVTVWARWGAAHGINAGDAMLILAERALIDQGVPLSPQVALTATRVLNTACSALCEGQYLDILWEGVPQVTVAQYLEMIEGKTARLFACSAELGAVCAEASEADRGRFAAFGRSLGLAFQAVDDLLGIWSPEAETGKPADLDVASRKKTLPILLGLGADPSPDRDRLRAIFSVERKLDLSETAEATEILGRLGTRERTEDLARRYRAEALGHLDHLGASHDVTALRELVGASLPSV